MNTNELLASLKNLKVNIHCDVISADKVKNIVNVPSPKLFICNLEPSHHVGSHWVVIYSPNMNEYEVFDSYGQATSTFGDFFKTIVSKKPLENCTILQSLSSLVCGQFCLFYAFHRLNNYSYAQILNKFGCSKLLNDRMVECFYENCLKCNELCKKYSKVQKCCARKVNMYNKKFI
jgi:hypothetical protein